MPLLGGGRPRDYLVASGDRMRLETPAFEDGGWIPARYTCEGEDASPPLRWRNVPGAARSFALIMYDPDAPAGTFVHWVLYDIPAGLRELPEGLPRRPEVPGVGLHGVNDFGFHGYGGPCPPRGHGPHRYYIALHALEVESLGLPPGARPEEVYTRMKRHVVGHAVIMGRYERR